MKFKRIVVWFRNDLRLSDNSTLAKAIQDADEVIPVYCFEPRMFKKLDLGFAKTGKFKTKFLIESVLNLRKNLQEKGANLFILEGQPEQMIVEFAKEMEAQAIYFSEETTAEELVTSECLEKTAWTQHIATEQFWQSTLYHLEDLPFPVSQIPEIYTQFRKGVEKNAMVHQTIKSPDKISFPDFQAKTEFGEIPVVFQDIGLDRAADHDLGYHLVGGECSALERIQSYFWKTDFLRKYKDTRNGLLGIDYSSKLSPWLALGCISPRTIYEEIKRYEKERVKNESTYWLIFELIWRDYFRFIAKKHGKHIFQIGGIKNETEDWSRDLSVFQQWCDGETGVPFIDANMRELNQTGYMSNRGRQNVASFLVNDLNIDWTWGASYFESLLIDYDPCSNWGNWMYIAGVGNDPRENRYFNILNQAKNYDYNGDFVRNWLPELSKLEGGDIHHPWNMNVKNRKIMVRSIDYPTPMVSITRWN
jgi:deoxyribodipyrimidine photo-lyase